jgi:peptide/nickel transport system ATP-binding protein
VEDKTIQNMQSLKLIDIEDLKVIFLTDQGIVEAIDNASLSIGKGEIMGLVGESGCGKTTIGKCILRVLPEHTGKIVSGKILFNCKDILCISEREMNNKVRGRIITLIPQDPSTYFNPVFTIGTQFDDLLKHKMGIAGIGNNGSNAIKIWFHSKRARREKLLELLRSVQVAAPEKQINKYPHEFSGGQRQRIMIAMALAANPELIIADEATTALDVTIEAQILVLLRSLAKERQTSVLFITHDLGVASEICDKITVMYAGQIVESAHTQSFFASPSHPYTRGLLNSLPNPRGDIRTIEGELPPLINPPNGCRFHPRCLQALPECQVHMAGIVEISTNHFIRCFNPCRT